MKEIQEIFQTQSKWDSKHINNVCERPVDDGLLRMIERGCSIEAIEDIVSKGYPVFKYKTQITIHGLFPEVEKHRIGGYKNLFQNKNKSIGVRWSAVDINKRHRIAEVVEPISKWYYDESSTEHSYHITKRYSNETLNELRELSQKIDTSLFFGDVRLVLMQHPFFGVYIRLVVKVNAVYDKNVLPLIGNLLQMDEPTWQKALSDYKAEQQRRHDEAERIRKEAAEKQRLMDERKITEAKAWIEHNNPGDGFERLSEITPSSGDTLARLKVVYDAENDKLEFSFITGVVKMAFGKTCIAWGENKRAKQIPTTIKGDFLWIKRKNYTPMRQQKAVKAVERVEQCDIKIIEYSDKAIAVVGDTKRYADDFKRLGGRFNPRLRCGCGWIFSKRKQDELNAVLR